MCSFTFKIIIIITIMCTWCVLGCTCMCVWHALVRVCVRVCVSVCLWDVCLGTRVPWVHKEDRWQLWESDLSIWDGTQAGRLEWKVILSHRTIMLAHTYILSYRSLPWLQSLHTDTIQGCRVFTHWIQAFRLRSWFSFFKCLDGDGSVVPLPAPVSGG